MIYPLHKKVNLANVQNYRNVISKIFIGISFDRLTHWSDINVHIPESQTGGRKGYSTIDNIYLPSVSSTEISNEKMWTFLCLVCRLF